MGILDVPAKAVLENELKNPESTARGLLSATYARFVDENGDPLTGKHVVIKVHSSTGEILDIVAEA